MLNEKYCVLVDAYSTGNQLAKHFIKYGYQVVHVQSSAKISSVFAPSFRPEDFDINIVHELSIIDTLNKIKDYEPDHVIAGAETGVELANELARLLSLPRNEDVQLRVRRNKYLMNELIKQNGLDAVEQIKTNQEYQAVKWARDLKRWPIVVKPLHSAASDGVTFCNDEGEVKEAFNRIFNHQNSLGIVNDEVLVQRFLKGPHFVVNAMTHDGRHYITDIWRHDFYKGDGTSVIYDKLELISFNEKDHGETCKYVDSILTILGVKYGPTHTEIRLTEDGPRLVEVNCRTMGLSVKEEVINKALTYSHSSLTVDCYVNPENLIDKINQNEVYKVNREVFIVFIQAEKEGVIQQVPGIDFLKKLPSFADVQLSKNEGDFLEKTKNVETHPGFIVLTSESRKQIEEDYDKIRQFEEHFGFFHVADFVGV